MCRLLQREKENKMAGKNKTHSGTKKRFKITGRGKVKRQHASASHLLSKKNSKRRRRLRSSAIAVKSDEKKIKSLLGK